MNWTAIAHVEAERLLRGYGLWVFAVCLVLNFLWTLHPTVLTPVSEPTVVLGAFQQGMVALVAVGSVLLSFQSVSRERESGALRTHLALPHTRTSILVGKVIGRSAAFVAMLSLVFVIGAVLAAATRGVVPTTRISVIWLLTIAHGVTGISLGVAISAIARTGKMATAITACYLLVLLLWDVVVVTPLAAIIATIAPGNATELLFLLGRLHTTGAYNVLTNAVIGVGNSAAPWLHVVHAADPAIQTNLRLPSEVFQTAPTSLHPAMAVITIAAWLLVPLSIAAFLFERTDVAAASRR